MEEDDAAKLMKAAALSLGFPTSEAESLANSMNTPSVVHQLRLNHKVEVIEYEKETDEEYGIAICEVCKEQEPEEDRVERVRQLNERLMTLTKTNKIKEEVKEESKGESKNESLEMEVDPIPNEVVVKSESDIEKKSLGQSKKFIHCTTCTLAFHFNCFRPVMNEMPGSKWSCPFCILDVSSFFSLFFFFFFSFPFNLENCWRW